MDWNDETEFINNMSSISLQHIRLLELYSRVEKQIIDSPANIGAIVFGTRSLCIILEEV